MKWQIIVPLTLLYLIILHDISFNGTRVLLADIENLNKIEGYAQYADIESGGSALHLHLMNDNTIYVISSNYKKYWKRITQAADRYRPIEIYYSKSYSSEIYPLEIRSNGKILFPLEVRKSLYRIYLYVFIAVSLVYFLLMRKMIRQIISKRRAAKEKRKQHTTILG